MKPPSRAELIDYLVTTGIAGQVATPRQNNLKHYRRLVEGDPYHQFGLTFQRKWTFSDVLALMAQRCGVVAAEPVGPYTLLRVDRGELDPGIPGQFFMLEAPGRVLPRPMSVCLAAAGELAFLIDAIGPLAVAAGAGAGVGFGWLAHRLSRAAAAMPTDKTDREADLLGSLGRIVTPPSAGRYGEVLLTRPSGPVRTAHHDVGSSVGFGSGRAHQVRNVSSVNSASVHAYSPPLLPVHYYADLAEVPPQQPEVRR